MKFTTKPFQKDKNQPKAKFAKLLEFINMKQFDIENVDPEMMDVVQEFPKIFLEPSEEVLDWFEKYPEGMPTRENLVNLRYGFEFGNGWKEIARGFCKEMQDLADKAEANGDKFQYKGCIMKEKFGEFRPQGDVDSGDGSWKKYREEYYNIMSKWEKKSTETCEVTGKPGKLSTNGGWCKTLCEEERGDRYEPI